MKKTNFLFIAAVALAFTACSSDDEFGSGTSSSNNELVAAQITAGIDGASTRAYDKYWENGDAIGVMVTSTTGSSGMEDMYKNVQYTLSSTTDNDTKGTFTAASGGIYFQDASETVTFAAYGPYVSGEANVLPGTDGVISGTTSDGTATDYIYASGATASKSLSTIVSFTGSYAFKHVMTKLIINVVAGDGVEVADVKSGTYTIGGLYLDGTFTIVTGNTPSGTAAATTEDKTASSITLANGTTSDTGISYTAILYPQTLGESTYLPFTATVNNQTYTNTNGIAPGLAAGYSYTYTVTVKNEGLSISACTIDDWSEGTGGSVDATM